MAIIHGWAFLKGIPLTGAHITLDSDSGALGTTARVVGPLDYSPKNLISNKDTNESGQLVGERMDDLEETLGLTLKLPSNVSVADMARIKQGYIVTLAMTSDTVQARYNGAWQIDSIGETWVADDAMQVKLSLRRNANLTLSAQGA
jgi:hypothetical protein